jgi:hypothetical protein
MVPPKKLQGDIGANTTKKDSSNMGFSKKDSAGGGSGKNDGKGQNGNVAFHT